jgi:hypothetical protein
MTMLTELRNRGVAEVCIVGCAGLKGLPDARFTGFAAAWRNKYPAMIAMWVCYA